MKAKLVRESFYSKINVEVDEYIYHLMRCMAFDGDFELGPESGNSCDIVYSDRLITAAFIVLRKGEGGSNIDFDGPVILVGDNIYFSYDRTYVAGNSDKVKLGERLTEDEENSLRELTENIFSTYRGKRLNDENTREEIETFVNMYETIINGKKRNTL